MSVRLRPEVRCTFDEDQGILRVTQKEIVEAKSSDQKCEQEVVIYALKVRSLYRFSIFGLPR